ncbi:MAG: aspartate carbamoyltransferase catalytic subunit [Planctomycetes bacterium]|nr:aspartate carbamoyltransferase catalytic subunit [Planctomycetota bacterium]
MPSVKKKAPEGWTRKDLLGLQELTRGEIELLLATARGFQEVSTRSIKKVPALRGKVVVTMFVEPSTRTRTSFELASARMSADIVDFPTSMSSLTKGESLIDTAKNIEAMGIDILIIRHGASGAPHLLAKHLKASVVNAGDGAHEHPTQGLLDIFTIREAKGRIEGLKVAIVGDISHSRVARSDIWGLRKLGAEVTVVGPSTLIPGPIEKLGVKVSHDLDAVLPEMDVINMLRIQMERQKRSLFPSLPEYSRLFGLNGERLRRAKPDLLILHPGPMNRGVEITPEVADGPQSVILRQVTNGLAVRMAVLYHVSGAHRAEGAPDA